jgi:hypothetical protein
VTARRTLVALAALVALAGTARVAAAAPASPPKASPVSERAQPKHGAKPAAPGGAARPAAPAAAAADSARRPDFSGTWKLDMEKSQFGKIPGGEPRERADVIVHHDPQLTQTLHLLLAGATRRDTTVYRYTTDGATAVNTVDHRDITAQVRWRGDTLSLESKANFVVFTTTLSERWVLSRDGATLTMLRHVTYPMGQGDQTLVFEKQSR